MATRYDPAGIQSEFEPRSRSRVLLNRLGIIRTRDIQLAESQALQLAQEQAIRMFAADHCFTAADICKLHKLWLGPVYTWAGTYREVNISKGGFQFATATLVSSLMTTLECGALARYTPCRAGSASEVAEALAVVHAELILVHPFREGNGRIARLLTLLMALQADLPPLDFSPLDGRGKPRYIAGIHAAMGDDYRLLTEMFGKVIDRTWKSASSSDR